MILVLHIWRFIIVGRVPSQALKITISYYFQFSISKYLLNNLIALIHFTQVDLKYYSSSLSFVYENENI